MKLIDMRTGELVADIMTNHSMSIDEVLQMVGLTVNEDGQLVNEDGNELNIWYEDLELYSCDVYTVKAEYVDLWGTEELAIVTGCEIERLAREWGESVDELMEQVEKIS